MSQPNTFWPNQLWPNQQKQTGPVVVSKLVLSLKVDKATARTIQVDSKVIRTLMET